MIMSLKDKKRNKLIIRLLARDSMLARCMLSSCVRLSACLSHAGIVPKRLNVGSRKQRHTNSTIATDDSLLMPKILAKF